MQQKRQLLSELLKDVAMNRVIVFTRTKHGANKVAEHLSKTGVKSDAIHGNKSQNARQRALDMFRTGKVRVLVATDIAARGIDIDDISHVVNFELPNEPESYVHRIGRTARAGGEGIAISFCDPSERGYLRDIERLTRIKIEAVAHDLPPLPEGQQQPQEEQRRHFHNKGRGGKPGGGHKPGGGEPGPRSAMARGRTGTAARTRSATPLNKLSRLGALRVSRVISRSTRCAKCFRPPPRLSWARRRLLSLRTCQAVRAGGARQSLRRAQHPAAAGADVRQDQGQRLRARPSTKA